MILTLALTFLFFSLVCLLIIPNKDKSHIFFDEVQVNCFSLVLTDAIFFNFLINFYKEIFRHCVLVIRNAFVWHNLVDNYVKNVVERGRNIACERTLPSLLRVSSIDLGQILWF